MGEKKEAGVVRKPNKKQLSELLEAQSFLDGMRDLMKRAIKEGK